jgi:hypothetical protein
LNKRLLLLLLLAIIASSIVPVLPVNGQTITIIVPDDYAAISSAIQHASTGDSILVKAGNYQDTVLELNKSISLIAESTQQVTLNLNPPLVEACILRNQLLIPVAAITIDADDVRIEGFIINVPRANYGYGGGIHAEGDRLQLIDNIMENNTVYLKGTSAVVRGNSFPNDVEVIGSNQTITDNLVRTLKLQGSNSRVIGNEMVDKSLSGKFYLNGSFNVIAKNQFPWIDMENSDSNVIVGNSLMTLKMLNCDGNSVAKNRFTGNWGYNNGISIAEGLKNTVTANNIRDCAAGVSLSGFALENSIYHNNFVNNSVNIRYYGDAADWATNNYFDDGAKGNYYENYKGQNGNGDGIGDSPFRFEGARHSEGGGVTTAGYAEDRYPLLAPVNVDAKVVDMPDWVDESLVDANTSETLPILPIAIGSAVIAVISVALLCVHAQERDSGKIHK